MMSQQPIYALRSIYMVRLRLRFYLSQLIGSIRLSVIVAIAPCEHLH